MLFNSTSFAVFFIIVFASYWFLRHSYRAQNLLLLAASYFFYGCWDSRFLVLIVLSTVVDYYCALSIDAGRISGRRRLGASALLILSAIIFLVQPHRAIQFAFSGWHPNVVINWSYFFSVHSRYWWMLLGLVPATVVGNTIYPFLDLLKEQHRRKFFLIFSIFANLLILGIFKYFNFFADSFSALTQSLFHITPRTGTLNIILPVGISFYTFQTMSYTIDVYRRKAAASRSLLEVAAYVSFFPQVSCRSDRTREKSPAAISKGALYKHGWSERRPVVDSMGPFQKNGRCR